MSRISLAPAQYRGAWTHFREPSDDWQRNANFPSEKNLGTMKP